MIKTCKKEGFPPFEVILGNFGHFWGISGENGVHSWPPRESKPAEKTVHHPWGVISEGLPRVNFALPACLGPKSTLGSTSEMTPYGAGLDSLGGQDCTQFSL